MSEQEKVFLERMYISEQPDYRYLSVGVDQKELKAFPTLDEAVSYKETEVGIYQLVRTAKFKKTAVEQVTLKEIV